ncbi:MAG: glycosyltransferase [Halarchaeum sp.]
MSADSPTGTERASWPAVVVTLALLVGTYAVGYELLDSWLFTAALALTGSCALVLVAGACWPRLFARVGSRRLPLWTAAVVPGVAALAVYRYVLGTASAALVAVALVAVTGGWLLSTATDVAGVGPGWLSAPVPVRLHPPLAVAASICAYLVAVGRFDFLTVAFLVATSLFSFYVWVVLPLGIIGRRTDADAPPLPDPAPRVDVLVPAYNEAATVARSVESALAADYPADRLHVYVVDDGSTDDTAAIAGEYPDEHVTVLRKENGGKHSALNYGLLCSDANLVATVDADSFLAPDALRRSVARLRADPDAAAIASNVKVENRDRLLTKLQALEYVVGINTFRRAFDLFGVVPVVPGCLGVFRRDALDDVDGYDPDTLTEDFDLTMQLLKAGWTVRTTEAVVWTQAPFTWRDFYGQRKRWAHGGLQTLARHADVLVDPDVGPLQRFMYPLKAVSLLSVPLVLPAILLAVALGPYRRVAMLVAFFAAVMALVAALAVALEREDLRLMAYFPFFVVGYRQLLDYTVVRGLVALLRRTPGEWGHVRRDPTDPRGLEDLQLNAGTEANDE